MERVETIPVVDTETGEIMQIPAVSRGDLYGTYSVISNKTVRQKEKLTLRWKNKTPGVFGEEMIKTNRGWFLDGWNIDERSVEDWFRATGNNRFWKPNKYSKKRNFKSKYTKKI